MLSNRSRFLGIFTLLVLFVFLIAGCDNKHQHTISFKTYGGNEIADIYVDENNLILEPTIPIKEGYTFDGWYSDKTLTNPYSFTTIPSKDITLYAKWIVNQYSLKYYDKVDPQIVSISIGFQYSAALTAEGHILTWGHDEYGQLGDGTTETNKEPRDITSMFNLNEDEYITSFKTGNYHTVALTNEGRIFVCGGNESGQLGDGTSIDKLTQTDITSQFNLGVGETIVQIEAEGKLSVALTNEGRIFTWGDNDRGLIGDGTTSNKKTPTDITPQLNLTIGETVIQIESSGFLTAALTNEGRVFTWGLNNSGEIGDGTTLDKLSPTEITSEFNLNAEDSIIDIETGFITSAAISSKGRVFIWGRNTDGQLGNGTHDNTLTPLEITPQFNLANESILSIELGWVHTVALTSEGRIFSWGSNVFGQLGDGSTLNKTTPTEITSQLDLNVGESITKIVTGDLRTEVITSEGRIFTWGRNRYVEIEDGRKIVFRKIPKDMTQIFPKILVEQSIHNYDYGSPIENFLAPKKVGYTFDGWYTDESLTTPFTQTTMPAEDITLYAKWIMK